MKDINVLYDFIDRAVKSRNYLPGSAKGLKAALKLFEKELTDEERASVDLFEAHLDRIQQVIFSANNSITPNSLATYKSRVLRVLSDYKKFGSDPTKMANWNAKPVARAKRPQAQSENRSFGTGVEDGGATSIPLGMQKIEHPIRVGVKVVVYLPAEPTSGDIDKIKKLLDLVDTND